MKVPFVEQTEEVRRNGRASANGLVGIVTGNPAKRTPEMARMILDATTQSLSSSPKVYWVEHSLEG